MKINLAIDKETVDKLLKMYGYTTEKVLVHFHVCDEDNMRSISQELGRFEKVIAYTERPKCLDKKVIMIDDVRDMGLDEVVNKLFINVLLEKLFS